MQNWRNVLCKMKELRHKKLHTLWFYLYDYLEKVNIGAVDSWVAVNRLGVGGRLTTTESEGIFEAKGLL